LSYAGELRLGFDWRWGYLQESAQTTCQIKDQPALSNLKQKVALNQIQSCRAIHLACYNQDSSHQGRPYVMNSGSQFLWRQCGTSQVKENRIIILQPYHGEGLRPVHRHFTPAAQIIEEDPDDASRYRFLLD
jgi:hypothetical protein